MLSMHTACKMRVVCGLMHDTVSVLWRAAQRQSIVPFALYYITILIALILWMGLVSQSRWETVSCFGCHGRNAFHDVLLRTELILIMLRVAKKGSRPAIDTYYTPFDVYQQPRCGIPLSWMLCRLRLRCWKSTGIQNKKTKHRMRFLFMIL